MNISPFDAWAILRVQNGHALNGEMERVSPAWRPFVDELIGTPAKDRPARFRKWMGEQPDAVKVAFAEASLAVDAAGPPPPVEPAPPAPRPATAPHVPVDAPIPPPSDAWAIRRLLCGEPVDDALVGDLPEPWRAIGGRLAETPLDDRGAFWLGMTTAMPNGNEIINALANVDPTADRPEPVESGVERAVEPRTSVVMRRASDIEAKPVEWLWRDRLPLGTLSLFAGDPKLGKSFVTVGLAAAVSRGSPLPMGDAPDGPASVVLMSAEDDPARTIVPRLKSAGAILENVHILESVRLKDGSDALPSLKTDVEAIESAVAGLGDCRLVVVDPISAYLGGVDDHRNAELRGVLSPLKATAERLNVCVLLVTHLNKGQGTNGRHRVTGSIAYVGACRANFLFARDRDDPTGRRVLMLGNGCNLAGDVPTLAFGIGDFGDGPTVAWEPNPVAVSVDDVMQAAAAADRGKRSAAIDDDANECDEWLRETLTAGPVPAADVASSGRKAGFTPHQLKRAKKRIGAKTKREGFGSESTCLWLLSCDTRDDDDAP